jgi:broad specificity phosphatase PhoE
LYDFKGNNVKSFIGNLPNNLSTVLIFTHNNSCNFLVNDFSDKFNLHVPTCGMLIFEFSVSLWAEIEKSKNFSFFFPKEYR